MNPAFAAFAECIATPVMLLTPDAHVAYANTAFERMTGVAAEHLVREGFPTHWLTHPRDALRRWQQLLRQAAHGDARPDPIQLSMQSAHGTEIEVQVHAAPWTDTGDSPAGFVVATFLQRHAGQDLPPQRADARGRHEGLIETLHDPLFALDPAGRFLSVDESWLERFGYATEEIIGTSAIDRVCPEFHDACRETFQTVRAGQPMDNVLFRAITKGGEPVNLLVNLTPVFDATGGVTQILGTGGDITELRQVQEELKRSEERLRILFQYAPDGCYLCDLQGRFLDVNQATAQISGRTRDELIGVNILELGLVPESELPMIISLFSKAAAGRPIPTTEFTACRKDGAAGTVEISGHPVVIEGQTLLLGAARDITERKQNEEKLKESLSLLKATLESTGNGIVVIDNRGTIKNFNEQFKDLWRLPTEVLDTGDMQRVQAIALPQLTDPEAFLAVIEAWHDRLERERSGTLHFKDGRVVEYCLKPQWLGDQIVGRVWSFRDVTATTRAQQEQEKLLQQVAQINEELSHFAYVVSHDLKAPLRGITMLAEWLCTDYGHQLDDEAKENFALLQHRVERMHNLIEGILAYSRVGRLKEDITGIDLDALLPEIIDAIAPPEHILIRTDGPLPVIPYEPTRMTQVFQNLLTNAVKYMDKPVGHVVVACAENESAWTFSISDNGPGIEAKHFDRIFKIFQTLAPRDEFESTGVGLTLVKKIVESCGGRIWITSEIGQGSTFFFTVPKPETVGPGHATAIDSLAVQSDDVSPDPENEPALEVSDGAGREDFS